VQWLSQHTLGYHYAYSTLTFIQVLAHSHLILFSSSTIPIQFCLVNNIARFQNGIYGEISGKVGFGRN
jgi:hypothetical protein